MSQPRDAVFSAFAAADRDLPICKIDVLHAKLQAFTQTQAGAIQQVAGREATHHEAIPPYGNPPIFVLA